MHVMHPDGTTSIFMSADISISAEAAPGHWVRFGHIGLRGLIVDSTEWRAFVDLVNEIDKEFSK